MERKKGDMSIEAVIVTVLVLVVVVIVIFSISNKELPKWVKSVFPDYMKENLTMPISGECGKGNYPVAVLSKENYIFVDGYNTNLYFDYEDYLIYLDDNRMFGFDKKVGTFAEQGGILIYSYFLNEKSEAYILEKDRGIPKISIMKSLDGSFKLMGKNIICKDENYDDIQKLCNLTCMDVSGSCLENDDLKINLGRLDCPQYQGCFVDNFKFSENIPDVIINQYKLYSKDGGFGKDLLKDAKLELNYGRDFGLELGLSINRPMCYILKTPQKVIYLDYIREASINYHQLFSWIPNKGEENLDLIIFDPNYKSKPYILNHKIKLGINYPTGSGKQYVLSDDELYYLKTKYGEYNSGDYFYVFGVYHDWGTYPIETHQGYLAKDYILELNEDNEFYIWVYDYYPIEKDWKMLDCYKDWSAVFDDKQSIAPEDIENSFTDTLVKHCGWD